MFLPVPYHHSNHQYWIACGAIQQGHQQHELHLQYRNVANPPAWEQLEGIPITNVTVRKGPASPQLTRVLQTFKVNNITYTYNCVHYTLVKTSALKLKITSLLYHTTTSLDSLHMTVLTTPTQPMNYITNSKSMITTVLEELIDIHNMYHHIHSELQIVSNMSLIKSEWKLEIVVLMTPYLVCTTCKEPVNWQANQSVLNSQKNPQLTTMWQFILCQPLHLWERNVCTETVKCHIPGLMVNSRLVHGVGDTVALSQFSFNATLFWFF